MELEIYRKIPFVNDFIDIFNIVSETELFYRIPKYVNVLRIYKYFRLNQLDNLNDKQSSNIYKLAKAKYLSILEIIDYLNFIDEILHDESEYIYISKYINSKNYIYFTNVIKQNNNIKKYLLPLLSYDVALLYNFDDIKNSDGCKIYSLIVLTSDNFYTIK